MNTTSSIPEPLQTLFQKLDEQDQLFEVIELFYERMGQDPMLSHFFAGRDLKSIAKNQYFFLQSIAGLGAPFQGRSPQTAHLELPRILSGHFDRRLKILTEVLTKVGLSTAEIQAWIAFENAFRAVLVQERPKAIP